MFPALDQGDKAAPKPSLARPSTTTQHALGRAPVNAPPITPREIKQECLRWTSDNSPACTMASILLVEPATQSRTRSYTGTQECFLLLTHARPCWSTIGYLTISVEAGRHDPLKCDPQPSQGLPLTLIGWLYPEQHYFNSEGEKVLYYSVNSSWLAICTRGKGLPTSGCQMSARLCDCSTEWGVKASPDPRWVHLFSKEPVQWRQFEHIKTLCISRTETKQNISIHNVLSTNHLVPKINKAMHVLHSVNTFGWLLAQWYNMSVCRDLEMGINRNQ